MLLALNMEYVKLSGQGCGQLHEIQLQLQLINFSQLQLL